MVQKPVGCVVEKNWNAGRREGGGGSKETAAYYLFFLEVIQKFYNYRKLLTF